MKISKEDALNYIRMLAAQNIISKSELNTAYMEGMASNVTHANAKKFKLMEVLSYIGGAIVFLGIIILASQYWEKFNSATKILITFGSGTVAYIMGLSFTPNEKTATVGSAFYLISGLLLPTGLLVIFDLSGYHLISAGIECLVSIILFIVYFLSFLILRKNIFLLFSIIFGTWFYYAFLNYTIHYDFFNDKVFEYATLILGLGYMILGYAFSRSEKKSLSGFLYSFGMLGFLGAALALGGYAPKQTLGWELAFPCLTLGAIFFSVYLKNKAFLIWGTLFLIVYIIKITSEYFSNTIGWPLSLILAGFTIIGVGYLFFQVKDGVKSKT